MLKRNWKRVISTRRFVERAESRLHRLTASCTLAVRDLPEQAIGDAEQRAIRHHLEVAETQLKIVLDTCAYISDVRRQQLTRAKFAQPVEKKEGEEGWSRLPEISQNDRERITSPDLR